MRLDTLNQMYRAKGFTVSYHPAGGYSLATPTCKGWAELFCRTIKQVQQAIEDELVAIEEGFNS